MCSWCRRAGGSGCHDGVTVSVVILFRAIWVCSCKPFYLRCCLITACSQIVDHVLLGFLSWRQPSLQFSDTTQGRLEMRAPQRQLLAYLTDTLSSTSATTHYGWCYPIWNRPEYSLSYASAINFQPNPSYRLPTQPHPPKKNATEPTSTYKMVA